MIKTKGKILALLTSVLMLAFAMVIMLSTGVFSTKTAKAAITSLEGNLTIEGASIRIHEDGKNGMRFGTQIDATYFEENMAQAKTGFLVVPNRYADGEELTITLNDGSAPTITGGESVLNEDTTSKWYKEGDYYLSGVYLYNFPEVALVEGFKVRAYVIMDGTTYYSNTEVRSMAGVAVLAKYLNATVDQNKVAELYPTTGYLVENDDTKEFEVYETLAINTTELTGKTMDLETGSAGLTVDRAILIDNTDKTHFKDVDVSADASGKLTLDGKSVGATIYGDTSLLVIGNNMAIYQPMNVITKKINTLDDMRSYAIYGGKGTYADDSLNKRDVFDGYFVLTTDLSYDDYWKPSTAVTITTRSADNGNAWRNVYQNTGDDGLYGFTGIFDGQGHSINMGISYHANNGGLLFAVNKGGVVKNLAMKGQIYQAGNYSWSSNYAFADSFSGTLENCLIELTNWGDAKNVSPFGTVAGMRAKDVVLKFDASNVGNATQGGCSAWLAQTVTQVIDSNVVLIPTFENFHAYINDPSSGALTPSNGYESWLVDAGVYSEGLIKHAYDDTTVTFAPARTDEWILANGYQPTFKCYGLAIEATSATDFEVYNSLDGTTPVANDITLNLTDYGMAGVDSITFKATSESVDRALTTDEYSVSGNTLTIKGSIFGATVYGDDISFEIKDTASGINLIYKVKEVITKKIATVADFQNISVYGGMGTYTDTAFNDRNVYDGYYVMTANIVTETFTKANGYTYNNKVGWGKDTVNTWTASAVTQDGTTPGGNYGFMGIFDGRGHSLTGLVLGNGGNGGIFGNVNNGGVVKNFALQGRVYGGSFRNCILAYTFSGTLQNCTIKFDAFGAATNVAAIADATGMRAIDVVFDFVANNSNAPVGTIPAGYYTASTNGAYIAYIGSYIYSSFYRGSSYTNVCAFVSDAPSGTTQPVIDYYTDQLAKGDFDGITKLAYDAESTFVPTDATYWDLTGSRPALKPIAE